MLHAIIWVIFTLMIIPGGKPTEDSTPPTTTIPFGGTDFKQYYTTSRLILEGHNPYDYEKAGVIQRALGEKGATQVPYGPPTSLLPFIPMGWVDFLTAIQIQFALNVGMLVVSCFLWGMLLFPQHPKMPLIGTAAVVAWIPCLSLMGMGHVTSWPLLGFTLWCFFMRKEKPALAGCCLALSIIKPHLALGPVIYAVVMGIRHRQWNMLLSMIGTVSVMIIATWAIRPTIWSEYFGSLALSNPTQWFNATLDGWGRFTFGPSFRFISAMVGLSLVSGILYLAWKKTPVGHDDVSMNTGPLVFALWMAATPYAFSYDYVLFLPAIVWSVGCWFYRSNRYWHVAIVGWIVLDGLYALMKGKMIKDPCYEYEYYFIPLAGLAVTALLWSASFSNRNAAGVAN